MSFWCCFGAEEEEELKFFAEAVSWDISLGAASTGLGRMILSATSESSEDAPDAIDHVGIKVYGYLYEYGDLGILKSELPPEGTKLKSQYPAISLRCVEQMGFTKKTQEEFEAWVEEQNNGDFSGSKYNLVTTSCVVWAKVAAEFLELPYPSNWDRIIAWTTKNKGFTSFVGSAGLGARKLEHTVTPYVTDPGKIKDKVKDMYKKLKSKDDDEDDNENENENRDKKEENGDEDKKEE